VVADIKVIHSVCVFYPSMRRVLARVDACFLLALALSGKATCPRKNAENRPAKAGCF
jgi:hypothetical protein